jgi:hypothetical protein
VDESDNQPAAAGADAFYAGEVTLSPGSRLDTNGLKLYTGQLSLGGNAHVNLRNGEMVVVVSDPASRAMRLAQIESAVRRGRDGGAEAGGILTTTTDPVGITGLAVGLVPGTDGREILVKHTYNGDANLDGKIDADGYFGIDSGFLDQPANPLYAQGDFNYDEKVNADDYFLIDSAFVGQQAAVGAGALAAVSVPEPGSGIASVAGVAMLLRRARRRGRRNDVGYR